MKLEVLEIEEKLAQLRKKLETTKDYGNRVILEKRIRALEIAKEKKEDIFEKAKEIFK